MLRTIVTPTESKLIIDLPSEMVGKSIEVIAFEIEPSREKKRTYEDAVKFYKKNSIDFSKLEKWNRENLYE